MLFKIRRSFSDLNNNCIKQLTSIVFVAKLIKHSKARLSAFLIFIASEFRNGAFFSTKQLVPAAHKHEYKVRPKQESGKSKRPELSLSKAARGQLATCLGEK